MNQRHKVDIEWKDSAFDVAYHLPVATTLAV